ARGRTAPWPSSRPLSVCVVSGPRAPVAPAVVHGRLDVLFEEIAGRDQLLRRLPHARQIVRARGVALGDGQTRIARRLTLGTRAGEGQRAPPEVEDLVRAAALGM